MLVDMVDTDMIDVADLPPEIHNIRQLSGATTSDTAAFEPVTLNEMEKKAIANALAMTGGNREQAAKILGIGERTLYRKIKEFGL